MRVTRDYELKTITLCQDKYISNMLQEYEMEDCHPVTTPMIPGTHLIAATNEEHDAFEKSGENYDRAVGLVNWLVQCTRPDLAFTASQLSQHLKKPGPQHWIAFKRVLRYLKGTSHLGLSLGGSSVDLQIYADSDYAACPDTRRSSSGYTAFVAGGCVSWRSHKQNNVSTSSTEAEYRAAYEGAQEAVWIRRLLQNLGYSQTTSTKLLCDNQSSMALQRNPLYKSRSKHFEVKYHWIREKVEDGTISPVYVPTAEMIADICTKALHRPQHQYLSTLLHLL